jgi:hypothetical protein
MQPSYILSKSPAEIRGASPTTAQRCDVTRRTAFDNRGDVSGPTLQRHPHRLGVSGAIVDTGNPAFVAANVVHYGFDYVRLNADLGHAGCGTAA